MKKFTLIILFTIFYNTLMAQDTKPYMTRSSNVDTVTTYTDPEKPEFQYKATSMALVVSEKEWFVVYQANSGRYFIIKEDKKGKPSRNYIYRHQERSQPQNF
jgi:hypothetical protein